MLTQVQKEKELSCKLVGYVFHQQCLSFHHKMKVWTVVILTILLVACTRKHVQNGFSRREAGGGGAHL
jgi:hypothetical protein